MNWSVRIRGLLVYLKVGLMYFYDKGAFKQSSGRVILEQRVQQRHHWKLVSLLIFAVHCQILAIQQRPVVVLDLGLLADACDNRYLLKDIQMQVLLFVLLGFSVVQKFNLSLKFDFELAVSLLFLLLHSHLDSYLPQYWLKQDLCRFRKPCHLTLIVILFNLSGLSRLEQRFMQTKRHFPNHFLVNFLLLSM